MTYLELAAKAKELADPKHSSLHYIAASRELVPQLAEAVERLAKVVELQRVALAAMSQSFNKLNLYSMPFTGTDYFSFKDEKDKKEGQTHLLAKVHERPFEGGDVREFLEATSLVNKALREGAEILEG